MSGSVASRPAGHTPSGRLYPERIDDAAGPFDRWVRRTAARCAAGLAGERRRLGAIANDAAREAPAARALGDERLRARLAACAPAAWRLRDGPALATALALAAEAARRTLGLEPFWTQVMGAACLLRGRLAEMQTGEGKSLTASLAAAVAASAGVPVHVATVNDYLARRDANEFEPFYRALGLDVGCVVGGMALADRGAAYGRAIAYCTGKELVFDYLKDRHAAGTRADGSQRRLRHLLGASQPPLLLRGLHYCIVDEADSVLIDEARTPLILSRRAGPGEGIGHGPSAAALELAAGLVPGRHYELRADYADVRLTAAGRHALTERSVALGRPWAVASTREHWVVQALRARHLLRRDEHYVVADGKVRIVDEQTGRILDGRVWEGGLQALVECKEGCAASDDAATIARITYQRFFRRYLRLAGMTGTAREVARELLDAYGLRCVAIPTHRPTRRTHLGTRVVPDEAHKWQAVDEAAAAMLAQGRPVLVGTRSVRASEALSVHLAATGRPHRVLNARQDRHEAELVASAGRAGALTVATNMAGRGTDIKLDAEVRACGGLHVILTEFHDSRRVDRQLFGRAARQGDPGSVECIVALDDDLFARYAGRVAAIAFAWRGRATTTLEVVLWRRWAQRRAEAIHKLVRRAAVAQDEATHRLLAFSGAD